VGGVGEIKMPNYRKHLLVGIAIVFIGYLILFYFNLISFKHIIFAPFIIFVSIISDIDMKKSKARKVINYVFLLSLLGGIIAFYLLLQPVYLLIITIITFIMIIIYSLRHRSRVTHNPIFGIVISSPLLFISPFLFVIAFLSFSSHLLLDYL